MFAASAALLIAVILVYLFLIRQKDLPEAAPVLPYAHLEARKAAIYDNLRDLQFEYRVGKLSDADYQTTKTGLQSELAAILAEIDRIKGDMPAAAAIATAPAPAPPAPAPASKCPHCGAKFKQTLKFCGECGKPMGVSA
jgi:hypothetical protein